MSRKPAIKPNLNWIQAFIAVGGGILLTFIFSPDARLLKNDISNHLFEQQLVSDSLFNIVPFKKDVQYCSTTNPRQSLDIFLPPSVAPTPLVIFIHGGGWTYGDKKSKVLSYYGEPLLKQGIAVASINYRLHPEGDYPDSYQDISCALDYLKAHASNFNISSEKWGIMGDSAGAELAAYSMQSRPEMPIQSFVGLYGPYDLGLQLTRTPKKDVDAANFTDSHDPVFATSISPIALPVKSSASYLLIHGQKDTIVPAEQSQKYHAYLKSGGANSRLILIPNSGHYVSPIGSPTRTEIRAVIATFFATLK